MVYCLTSPYYPHCFELCVNQIQPISQEDRLDCCHPVLMCGLVFPFFSSTIITPSNVNQHVEFEEFTDHQEL